MPNPWSIWRKPFCPRQAPNWIGRRPWGRVAGLLKEGGAGLARLVQAADAPRVVLVVDQFEEVFTRCADVAEREQFFACLMGALAAAGDKLCLIIAMRSDFVGKCLERD
jgi:deoxyxylulose-5-phosphate synthase